MSQLYVLIMLLIISLQGTAAPLPPPQVVKISDRVYAFIGPNELPNKKNQGYIVNSAIIIGDKGVIIVDTGFTKAVGAHLLQAAAKITPKPITHIINTHDHGDHFLGNGAFPNAEIWSSERCKTSVTQHGYEALALIENFTQLKFPDTKPIPASFVFNENTRTEKTIHGVRIIFWCRRARTHPVI